MHGLRMPKHTTPKGRMASDSQDVRRHQALMQAVSHKQLHNDLMQLFHDAKEAGGVVEVGAVSPLPISFSPPPVFNNRYSERVIYRSSPQAVRPSSASSHDSSVSSSSSSASHSSRSSFGWALNLFTRNLGGLSWRRFRGEKVRQGMDGFSQSS